MPKSVENYNISNYRTLIGIGEGLSFSDQYDDDIPGDVKPPQMLRPMEEMDYPIQAKDLFKRAYTETTKNQSSGIFIVGMKPEQKEKFKSSLAKLFSHLRNELKLKTLPSVHLVSDQANANKMLGKTGYYDAANKKICLYITGRHPKDILRSFSHEVIHHWQHENKQLDKSSKKEESDPQYAQNDPWMRQMEKQAYLLGNILFRDWEDAKKAEDRKSTKKLAERTYKIGKEYPPKKTDYSG